MSLDGIPQGNVWFAIPSIRTGGGTIPRWREMGYRIAVLRQGEPIEADLLIPTDRYLGWANSTNILAKEILARDPKAQWVVGGGDDYLPDLAHSPERIAQECEWHFAHLKSPLDPEPGRPHAYNMPTFGIMQPTGDRWGADDPTNLRLYPDRPALIDRICGSPWMGREWCERAYGGRGPMWGEYHHMFADEDLQNVAIQLGVFLQRRDLIQYHDHWQRGEQKPAPDFLVPVNSEKHWDQSRQLFRARKSAGWPGHEPLPVATPVIA